MHTNMFSYCFGEHERPNDPPESFVPTSMKNTTNIIIIVMIDVWGGVGSHDDGFGALATKIRVMFTICVHKKALCTYVCMYVCMYVWRCKCSSWPYIGVP